MEALDKKHEKDEKKSVSSRYCDKRRQSSVGESGAKKLDHFLSMVKQILPALTQDDF